MKHILARLEDIEARLAVIEKRLAIASDEPEPTPMKRLQAAFRDLWPPHI